MKPRIDKALKDDVAHAVIKVEQRNIEKAVYGATAPRVYERRKYAGGLIAESSFKADLVGDGELLVRNAAGPNKRYKNSLPVTADLPALIEYGDGYDDMRYNWKRADGTEWEYRQPRPFTKNAADELRAKKQHVAALKHGLGVPIV